MVFSPSATLLFFALIYNPGNYNVDGADASKKCGISGFILGERIVGGQSVSVQSQPWYVALVQTSQLAKNDKNRRKVQDQGPTVFCGGALITNKHVVTAAHCYYTLRAQGGNWKSKLAAVLGLSNRCTSTWSSVVRVSNVDIHPRFNLNSLKNDIALVTLQTAVLNTIVCMPGQNAKANQTADIIGYGTVREGARTEPCTLQKGNVTILSKAVCLQTEIGSLVKNSPAVLCAGRRTGSVDTCQGDSGGPLLVLKNGQYVLHGITSFGNGCGRPDSPGAYTNVYAYRQWINFRVAASNTRGPSELTFLTGMIDWFLNRLPWW